MLTLANRYKELESDDDMDDEEETLVSNDFWDNQVRIAQRPVTVQNEFNEVIYEEEDEETEYVIDEFVYWRGHTEEE